MHFRSYLRFLVILQHILPQNILPKRHKIVEKYQDLLVIFKDYLSSLELCDTSHTNDEIYILSMP